MKDGLDKHALVVWRYIWETVRRCDKETATDYEFVSLMLNMYYHYPDEFKKF